MKAGETITVQAEWLSKHGDGVGRLGDMEIHVAGLLPGETGDVKLDYVSKQRPRAHGQVLTRRNTHPGRRPAPCRHHGRCNGCALMDMDLASQRELKRLELERTHGILVDRLVTESRDGRGYRFSSKRVFAGPPGRIVLGSYMRTTHNVADMRGCLVDHPDISACADELGEVASELLAVPFDENDGEGDLRYAWFKTDGHGQTLVAIITAEPLRSAVHDIAARLERPAGVAWGVKSGIGNDMRGVTLRPLRGRQSVAVDFGDAIAHVGPLGFLQPNPAAAAIAYHDLVHVPAGGALHGRLALDLYAGAGVTTSLLRSRFDEVVPCESYPDSARTLGCEPELVEEFLARLLADAHHPHRSPDLVVANPPRGGLGGTVCEQLNELHVPRLHLMSCNPASLAEDLRRLTGEHGRYRVFGARAFDTLPQTNHIEVVVWLVGRAPRVA
ncbi:MAG: class I SAM-dependent RNA methyltransferase [Deltaproteobacteria bacterium]|nr:class I SAM-dependent RNA methyltransferase [Nannocystaceae bacterium]